MRRVIITQSFKTRGGHVLLQVTTPTGIVLMIVHYAINEYWDSFVVSGQHPHVNLRYIPLRTRHRIIV